MKYLYGASVQGIQSYIFRTNKLKKIIVASNQVESICTTIFDKYLDNSGDTELIIGAAGNIRCIFSRKQDCEKVVLNFKKEVMLSFPGITLSQAVVEYDESTPFSSVIEELEGKLRTQRNINCIPTLLGFIGMERSRQTGLPIIKDDKSEGTEESNMTLARKLYGCGFDPEKIPYNIGNLTNHNNWIAVIHADGNGLGNVVMKIGANEKEYCEFSRQLDVSTQCAAYAAFAKISTSDCKKYPIRPVILGGDDITVICRADLALPFCNEFLSEFKRQTQSRLGNILKRNEVFEDADYLTACAGIAFIKSNYPFFYGYSLANSLCEDAKRTAKNNRPASLSTPSCIMFHKVQDSFVIDYKDITQRELTPQEQISWKFGPYFLPNESIEGYWTIDHLAEKTRKMDELEQSGIKAGLREWMSAMHRSEEEAHQKLNRIMEITERRSISDSKFVKSVTVAIERNGIRAYPVYDLLSINTITNQKTIK